MTEATGIFNQHRNIVITGAAALLIFGGGALALLHHHSTKSPIRVATTQRTPATHPATTRAVKHRKKHA